MLTTQEIGDRPFVTAGEYFLDKGILYRHNDMPGHKHLFVVPSVMRQSLVREYHDTPAGGHHGREKTLARFQQRFYWSNMAQTVRHLLKRDERKREIGSVSGESEKEIQFALVLIFSVFSLIFGIP